MMFSCVCFVYIIDDNKKVTKQLFGFYKYQNELGMFNFCPFLWLPPSIGSPTSSIISLLHANACIQYCSCYCSLYRNEFSFIIGYAG